MKYVRLNKQLYFFVGAGSLAVFTDCVFYFLSVDAFGPNISKIIGFYAGVAVSFFINSRHTFVQTNKQFINTGYFLKYVIALTTSMILNVIINYFFLKYFELYPFKYILAFIMATIFSMTLNFLTMKYLVFK